MSTPPPDRQSGTPPLRQLVVIAEMGSGGAESIVVELARLAVKRGDEVVVASNGGWRTRVLTELGARDVRVPLQEPGVRALLRATLLLRRRTAREHFDVVHAHNVRAAVAARLAVSARSHRPRVVVTVHGLDPGRYRAAARLLRLAADHVVAVSGDVRVRLEQGGLRADRITVIQNAPGVIEPAERSAARALLAVRHDTPVVLCLARMERPKRHDLLLDAWPEVPGALLLLAGDGSLRDMLQARARRLGLEARVRFLGNRQDVGVLLGAADVLVLPSDHEGLPVAVLEAMASGVLVVASDVGGLTELDRDTVRLVAPGSVEALADGLRDALNDALRHTDEGQRRRLLGRRLVRDRYSAEAMDRSYGALLLHLTGNGQKIP